MNKKLLCCALLGALGFAQAAAAQEYDDRWYVSGDLGVVLFDGERGLQDSAIYRVGFGRFFAPNWSWELGLNSTNPDQNAFDDLHWSMYGIDLTGRYHFIREDRNWHPYLMFGVGALRHEHEFPSTNAAFGPFERKGTELEVHGGFGLMADYGRFALRGEMGFRTDFDDRSGREDNDSFTDFIASVGVVFPFGPEPDRAVVVEEQTETVVETTPEPTCADMDDDGDGVNNCDDKCPTSTAGQTIGPDGCPVPEPAPQEEMPPQEYKG